MSRATYLADPRLIAVRNVMAVLDGRSLDSVLDGMPPEIDPRDRALAAEMSFGVCRWYRRLDAFAGLMLHKPLKQRDLDLHVLILVGIYQLLYSRVPPHAAVSTTVNGAQSLGKGWARKLVNGTLRRLQRETAALSTEVDRDPVLRFALPDWLYRQVEAAWPQQSERIFAAWQQRPPMTLRVDRQRLSRADYASQLADAGIAAQPHPGVATALVLDAAVPVDRLPGFDRALVSVQDAGAQLAGDFLDVAPGQRILDACAAPGGKTLDILQRVRANHVVALDVDRQRLGRVEQNLGRAGLHAELACGDAAAPDGNGWSAARYDRILVDAPCSATGVMRRHPDIRLLRRQGDIAALVGRQAAILDALWPLLEAGGRLLYVTCSVLPDENERQIDAFLERHADALPVDLPLSVGTPTGKGVQLLPGIDETDGFYYAALQKGAAGQP
jgi:16S rRNA (cytosine967-C5)-methyltransferase